MITDDEAECCVSARGRSPSTWLRPRAWPIRAELVRRAGQSTSSGVRSLAGNIIVREMGKPIEQALGEVDFCGESTGCTPTTPRSSLMDERMALLGGERHQPSCAGAPWVRCSESCRGTSTTRWRVSPPPNLADRRHYPGQTRARSARSRPAALHTIFDDAVPPRARTMRSRDGRPDRGGDRRPAHPGVLLDGPSGPGPRSPTSLGALSRRSCSRWSAKISSSCWNGPTWTRRSRTPWRPVLTTGSVVVRGQRLDRGRRSAPALPRQVHRGDDRDEVRSP